VVPRLSGRLNCAPTTPRGWKLDRPVRHLVDSPNVQWSCSLQKSIDTTTGGQLIFNEMTPRKVQCHLIRERTSAGLAAARARGRHGGRPSVLTDHKLKVAQEMYSSGQYTVAAIAKTLGVSRASIYRHLTRAGG
jgi:hypothetical protein